MVLNSLDQEEMMSEGGDHESWDDDMMATNENNDPSLSMVSILTVFFLFFQCQLNRILIELNINSLLLLNF